MLINKWLVIDSFDSRVYRDWSGGFCLDLYYERGEMSDLYKELQRLPVENRFTIVLPGKNSMTHKPGDSYIEKIISLFFQPSYFLAKGKPVVFLNDNATDHLFIEKLGEKCMKQGLSILMLKTKNAAGVDTSGGQFAYEVTSAGIDYEAIIENWLSLFLEDKDPREIHFL